MEGTHEFHAGRLRLAPEAVEALRARFPSDSAPGWAVEDAHEGGWIEVNRHYLQQEQERGAQSMRALMETLGVDAPKSVEEALDLIELALHVFVPAEGFQGATARTEHNELRIVNPYCPVFRAIEERNWRGVTACPSWHIRRGWLDALGVDATDSVMGEKKWGDPACAAVIRVEALAVAV